MGGPQFTAGGARRALGLAIAIGLTVALGTVPVAAASEPNRHASCIGIERAAISPPGSSDEIAGGSVALNAELKDIAGTLGVSPGAVTAFIAHLRAGLHEACDAALE